MAGRRAMGDKELGTVNWFKESRGYGFINRDGGGDIFVHASAIQMESPRTLHRGLRVEFSIVQSSRGPQASDAMPLYAAKEARWERPYT
jgi:CspA family cold shock protein